MAHAEATKEAQDERLAPLEKENNELREELETLKEELQKTEDVEKQVKDVLEKFEGILKTSEADNQRLRAELAQSATLREENEALKLFVQKATVMVTEERAKNLELTRLVESSGTGNQRLEQSRSTVDVMRESLRSRKSAEGSRRSEPNTRFDEDQGIKEATEDEENEASGSGSNSRKMTNVSRKDEKQINVNLEGPISNKKQAPTSKRTPLNQTASNPSLISQTPLKQAASSQSVKQSDRPTPSVKVADSSDFRANQKPVQLKKQPNPVVVRGSQATELTDYYTQELQALRDAAETSDDAGDELYQSHVQKSARGSGLPSKGSQPSQDQLMELLEQNKQLKMMNQLLHSSQKQLFESKQQHLEQTLSKVDRNLADPGAGTHPGRSAETLARRTAEEDQQCQGQECKNRQAEGRHHQHAGSVVL